MKNHRDTLTNTPLFADGTTELLVTESIPPKTRKKSIASLSAGKVISKVYADELIRQSASLFNLVSDAIIAKTADGKIMLWNPGAEQMSVIRLRKSWGARRPYCSHPTA